MTKNLKLDLAFMHAYYIFASSFNFITASSLVVSFYKINWRDGAFAACTRASLCEELKTNIFTIYFLFPVSISCNLNLLFKYLIKYLNYDKFLEDFLRYLFPSEFENFSNILVFFKNDAHLFLNYFLHIVN
jgi:hypothetical protein